MSYRKQLIQLAKFYRIVEIKNYFKSAKKLTTSGVGGSPGLKTL